MADRLAEVESRLARIERRLAALEESTPRPQPAVAEEQPAAALGDWSFSRSATHLGRVLLIFGGAYLLRAITDTGLLPIRAGIPIGAAYALFWLFMAYRSSSSARSAGHADARVYGAVSVLLGLPVLIEAVTRFELLSGAQSALALTAFYALYLLTAARRDLRSLAWFATAACLLVGALLMKISGAMNSFAGFFVLLGLASLWAVYLRPWKGLQWLGAAGANLGVMSLGVLSVSGQWLATPATALGLGLALWCGYLFSFVARSHFQGREPGLFEAVQAALASALTAGLAVYAERLGGISSLWPGVLMLALGITGYALAFTPKTGTARGPGYYFYGTLGLVLVIAGSALLFSPARVAVAWSLLALALAWASGRSARVSLSLHCTLLLFAACLGSGVLFTGVQAFAGDPAVSWPAPGISQLLVAAIAVACLFVPVAQRSDRWGGLAALPQLLVRVLAGWSVGGLIVTFLAPMLAGVPGASTDPGRLAALRTAVLAAAAITLALSSRHVRWPEARWLAYPALIVAGLKLVLEDFPIGRPLTLFIALALVGGALILVSRLLPRRSGDDGPTAAHA
ncbi:MAG TPA: hypothetical protein VKA17_04145 [Gammaproteobacteria bacterium]|nr:hypothetical protein [Gammaproteobacteria bacterium]